jgi:hypothetical protein
MAGDTDNLILIHKAWEPDILIPIRMAGDTDNLILIHKVWDPDILILIHKVGDPDILILIHKVGDPDILILIHKVRDPDHLLDNLLIMIQITKTMMTKNLIFKLSTINSLCMKRIIQTRS